MNIFHSTKLTAIVMRRASSSAKRLPTVKTQVLKYALLIISIVFVTSALRAQVVPDFKTIVYFYQQDNNYWTPVFNQAITTGRSPLLGRMADMTDVMIWFYENPDNVTPYLKLRSGSAASQAADSIHFFSIDWANNTANYAYIMRDSMHAHGHKMVMGISAILAYQPATASFLSAIVQDPNKTKVFISTLSSVLKLHRFDGVDFNWEFPTAADKPHMAYFFKMLRDSLNYHLGSGAYISITIDTYTSVAANQNYDIAAINQYCDYLITESGARISGHGGAYSGNPNGIYHPAVANFDSYTFGDSTYQQVPQYVTVNGMRAAGMSSNKVSQFIATFVEKFDGIDGPGQPVSNITAYSLLWPSNGGGPLQNYLDNYYQTGRERRDASQNFYISYTDASGKHLVSVDDSISITQKITMLKARGFSSIALNETAFLLNANGWKGNGDRLSYMSWIRAAIGKSISPPPPDIINPIVSITSPANGSTVSGTISISANASDNVGVVNVEFYVSGILRGSDASSPYSYSWSTTGLSGSQTITAKAYDAAGNVGVSSPVSVTVVAAQADTTKPTVAITSPLTGSTVSGVVNLTATSSDNIGVTKVDFLVNGSVLGSDATSPYTFSWNTAGLTGNQVITAKAYDAAGNIGASASVTVNIQVPATADQWIYQDALQSPWIDASWNSANTYGSLEHVYAGSSSIKAVETAWGGVSMHSGPNGAAMSVNPGLYSRLEFAVYNMTAGLNLNILFLNDLGQSFPSVQQNNVPVNQWTIVSIPMSQLNPGGMVIDRIMVQNYTALSPTFYLDNIRLVGNAVATVPPVPVLASPANGASNQPISATLSWGVSNGATSYGFQLSASPTFVPLIVNDSTLTVTSKQVTALGYTTLYYWRVRSKNSNGVSGYSSPWSFTTMLPPDTTRPTVAITSPVTGSTVTGVVNLTATSSDNIGVTKVDFLINGTVLGSDATSPYTLSWNTAGLTGNQVITAKAYDAAGNVGTSASITVGIQVPATADQWIYQDAVKSPWIDASWNSTNVFSSTERAYAGAYSIKAVETAWGGLSLHSGSYAGPINVNPGLYSKFEFAVYNTTAGLVLNILFQNDQGQTFTSVQQSNLPLNQWIIISIPMAQLNPSGYIIHRFIIQNYTSSISTFYVDNIRFVGNALGSTTSLTSQSEANSRAEDIPASFEIGQNYPNPFNPSTTIQYSLPDEAQVSMKIYNSLGEEIAILVNGIQSAGHKSVTWDGSRYSSGVYFCRLVATSTATNQTFNQMKRMLLVK